MLERAFVLGVDHLHGSADFRQDLMFLEEEILEKGSSFLEESMVLSTCNRFELYGVLAKDSSAHELKGEITRCLSQRASCSESVPSPLSSSLEDAFYFKDGVDMVQHGFRVVSSLESMVLGEPQILGQMRQAYRTAKNEGCLGSFMERFCSSALKVGKRVHHETGLNNHKVSMASLAIEKAQAVFGGSLKGRRVLLLGAGVMGVAAGRHLKDMGEVDIAVVSRGTARGENLIKMLQAKRFLVEDLQQALLWADVVVCSTSDTGVVISTPLVAPVLEQRGGRELIFLDIAMPRDVARNVSSFENVQVYGIDELSELSSKGQEKRKGLVGRAEKIIFEEMNDFARWDEERKKLHMIKQMRTHFEQMRDEVLGRYKSEETELATRLLMNKLLHEPLMAIKGEKFSAHCMEHILQDVFGLSCPRHTSVEQDEELLTKAQPHCPKVFF